MFFFLLRKTSTIIIEINAKRMESRKSRQSSRMTLLVLPPLIYKGWPYSGGNTPRFCRVMTGSHECACATRKDRSSQRLDSDTAGSDNEDAQGSKRSFRLITTY